MNSSADRSYTRIASFPLGELLVCFDTQTGTLMACNAVGREIWQAHVEGLAVESIVGQLARRFDAPAATLRTDTEHFLELLECTLRHKGEPADNTVPSRPCRPVAVRSYTLPTCTVTVHSEQAGVLDELDRLWKQPVARASNTLATEAYLFFEAGRFTLTHRGHVLEGGIAPEHAAIRCARNLGRAAAAAEPWVIGIHAAAVAMGGHGILLPAVSGSGKSTLAAWLMSTGCELLNDDLVVLRESDLAMVPTGTPLSIKSGVWPLIGDRFPALFEQPVHDDGRRIRYLVPEPARVCQAALACSLIVIPHYDALHPPARVRPAGTGTLLRSLLEGGSALHTPASAHDVGRLVHWLDQLPAYTLDYSDIDEATRVIATLVRCIDPDRNGDTIQAS